MGDAHLREVVGRGGEGGSHAFYSVTRSRYILAQKCHYYEIGPFGPGNYRRLQKPKKHCISSVALPSEPYRSSVFICGR